MPAGIEPTPFSAPDVQALRLGPHRTGSLVLVAVDGSPAALRAAAYAVGLARRQRAALLFVRIWVHPVAYGVFPQALPDCLNTVAEASAHLRAELQDLIGASGPSWELLEISSDPLAELTRIEADTRADIVVLGATGHRWPRLRSGLAGSLIRRGRCPVLVVP